MIRRFLRRLSRRDRFDLLQSRLQQVALQLETVGLESRIASALARASATASLRTIDPQRPLTWEFSGFSQHGEDGILDYLCSNLLNSNRFFFEIGAADGIQNCTAWLAYARNYGGVWVEGHAALSALAQKAIQQKNWAVHCVNLYVNKLNVPTLVKMCRHLDPDVFSLDVDGMDYYIADAVLGRLRPKIWIVEYNSVFGSEKSVTIPYEGQFDRWNGHPSGLYYGCSLTAWRRLFDRHGYRFVTVESSGTNAFFLDPAAFPAVFADNLQGESFRDNEADLNGATRPYRDEQGDQALPDRCWKHQYELIRHLPLIDIH